jgi:hypothetical protein
MKIVGKNTVGQHSGLTALFPIRPGTFPASDSRADQSVEVSLRSLLRTMPRDESSPFALVPNTYFARFFILKNLVAQPVRRSVVTRKIAGFTTRPVTWIKRNVFRRELARHDELQSRYLVWTLDVHGPIEDYLRDLWASQTSILSSVFGHCRRFHTVTSASDFVSYVQECQVDNALLFMGSTDQSVAEQLKALYLKQQFSDFVANHQTNDAPTTLWTDFQEFCHETQPDNLIGPTWRAGAATLDTVLAPNQVDEQSEML